MDKRGILDILKERPVIGDGSYVITLEKRGYVLGGPWTPEAVVEHPYAVRQLHREYIRAGSDLIQAFTFYATEGKLATSEGSKCYTSEHVNQCACDIAREVVDEAGPGTLICGGISPTPTYEQGKGKEAVQAEFHKQVDVFLKNKLDFLLAEFFISIEEVEWAVEVLKKTGLPVAVTMRVGNAGDSKGVPATECAVRMAKTGADIVGTNCNFDPDTSLKTMKAMKEALDKEGLKPYLMMQPLGFWCPEVTDDISGYFSLPEAPFALEPRLLTRWDARKFAREAYDLGVRYIGGCCGLEPYHIREMAEELAEERGRHTPGKNTFSSYGAALRVSVVPVFQQRGTKEHWTKTVPRSGRPQPGINSSEK